MSKKQEELERLTALDSSELDDPFWQTPPGSYATSTINEVEFTFRYCPRGDFTSGDSWLKYLLVSPWYERRRGFDEARRQVTIAEGFWICETATTQEQWDGVVVKKTDKRKFQGAKLPIESVAWHECASFVQRLNELGVPPKGWRFDLPTEEEWEYACRAGTSGGNLRDSLRRPRLVFQK